MSVAVGCTPDSLRAAVAGGVGEPVEREGALLAEYESVGAALAAAVQALDRADGKRAPRIGIAHGGVLRRADELRGAAADQARALVDVATAGEALVGDVVRALAGPSYVFEPRRSELAGAAAAGAGSRAGAADGTGSGAGAADGGGSGAGAADGGGSGAGAADAGLGAGAVAGTGSGARAADGGGSGAGAADGVAGWRLVSVGGAGIPLPAALRGGPGRWPFVGRDAELAAVCDSLAGLESGERGAFLVSGEPGIGKTRLLSEAALAAHASGAVVLYGRSDEGVGQPYQPFAEALTHYANHGPAATLEAAGARELAALVPAFGDQEGVPRPLGAVGDRYLLFAAVASLLTAACRDAPLLLALDDLQWADEPTVLLLRHLLMAPGPLRLLVLAGYRPGAQGPTTALAELRRDERVRELALGGLGDEQIAALVERAAGEALDDRERAFAGALQRDTGGNPLFASEVLHSLGDRDGLRDAADRLAAAERLPAPPTVRELIASRVARLGGDVEQTLAAAAVIGSEFDLDALLHVAEFDGNAPLRGGGEDSRRADGEDSRGGDGEASRGGDGEASRGGDGEASRGGDGEASRGADGVAPPAADVGTADPTALQATAVRLAAAIDLAVEAGLVEPDADSAGCFAFRHGLIRTTLYERQGPAGRGVLHRHAAEYLDARVEERPGPLAAPLAEHWREAVPAAPERALRWATLAGQHALDQLEPHAATRWHERALELLDAAGEDDDRRRAELLIGLGVAQRQRGDAAFRETLLEAARLAGRRGETELVVAAALANTRGFVSASGAVDEERIAVLRGALELVGPEDSRERALLLATLASERSFAPGFEARLALSDEAVAIARRVGDAATLCRVLSARFVPVWVPETLADRLQAAEESVRIADELGDPLAQFAAIHWHGVALVQDGRIEAARRAVEREAALAAKLGEPTAGWLALYDAANLAILAGRLDEAERLAGEALASGLGSDQPDALSFYANQLMNIRYEQGRLAEQQPDIAELVAGNPGIPALRALLALSCVEADLEDQAAELLAAEALAELPRDVTWLAGQVIWAHVCAAVGDAERAAPLYARLEPFAAQVAYTGISAWGDVDHALGRLAALLGRHDDAERHLLASRERYRRLQAPVWVARAAVDEAAVRIERGAPGDAERVQGLIELAREEGRRLGAERIVQRAQALAQRERSAAMIAELPRTGRVRTADAAAPAPPAAAGREDVTAADDLARAARRDGVVVLRRSGDVWTLRSEAGELHLKDSKGLHHLARLLSDPHEEVHVLELTGTPAEPVAAGRVAELDLHQPADDAGPLLDAEAKRAYRERLDDLEQRIAEAEAFNDPERGALAREERDAIAQQLAAAVGLGGRDRVAASAAERARVNATRAIRKAIDRIEAGDPALGAHLDRAVRTGTFCVYDPAPQDELRWELVP